MKPESLAEYLERWDIAITFCLRVKSWGICPSVRTISRSINIFRIQYES
jgi:hypothetical protein